MTARRRLPNRREKAVEELKVHRHLSLYDGRDLIGVVVGHGRDWRALDPRGNVLSGNFKSAKAAVAAITAHMDLTA